MFLPKTMEGPREDWTSPSVDFVMWLYIIYGILHLLVFLFDYFLWKIKLQSDTVSLRYDVCFEALPIPAPFVYRNFLKIY